MSLNYANKYASVVDERFRLGSLTAGIVNNNFDFIGVSTVNVYSRDLATLGNYTMSGTQRYGSPSDLGNAVQEMTLSQDKAFTYIIDRKTKEDTVGTMEAAATLAENINNVVIPWLDTYRIAKIIAAVPTSGTFSEKSHIVSGTVTKSNAYEEFLKVQECIDEDKAPVGGRVCMVTPAYYNLLKLDNSFIRSGDLSQSMLLNGQVGEVDGVPIVKAPSIYFPEGVDFFITNPIAAPSPVKFAEYKIHTDAPGISGSLIEARLYADCFVLNHKKDAIGVHGTVSGATGATN